MAGNDLTEQSLEQALIEIRALMNTDSITLQPTKLIIPGPLRTGPHYKVVKHKTRPYVRNYKRPVKGGKELIAAVFECIYAQPERNENGSDDRS